MNEYLTSALANKYTRAVVVGLAVGTAATTYPSIASMRQSQASLETTVANNDSAKIYKITCPEGFTALKWALGEGYKVSDQKATEMYQSLNGEGHIPQPGRSTLFLEDKNGNFELAGVKVTPADEVKDVKAMQDLVQQRTRRYNRK